MSNAAPVSGSDGHALSPGRRPAYAHRMKPPVNDAELMLRYKRGDLAAFETLYRRHNDALYRYLLRLSRNPDTAADVFQDAWSKIIASRDRYRPTATFRTFLFRVAHNCFIDQLRRSQRRPPAGEKDPDTLEAPLSDPLGHASMSEDRARLLSALNTLPEAQQHAFLLHQEAGLSIAQIAEATGVNKETAKSRLRYAMNKLKRLLQQPDGNPAP
ncbi:MAG: sigma-70 family RNA polymerase sigma factor [Woeseia sp.]